MKESCEHIVHQRHAADDTNIKTLHNCEGHKSILSILSTYVVFSRKERLSFGIVFHILFDGIATFDHLHTASKLMLTHFRDEVKTNGCVQW